MSKVVQVAVAILIKPSGEYLLASRPTGKGWAGWWEFPGGKIEAGETPEAALSRELQEELSVKPTDIQPWIKRQYDYPATDDAEAKTVLLHFFFVKAWQAQLRALEGQLLAWQQPHELTVSPILPANAPIMHALALPAVYAISNLAEMGEVHFMHALESKLKSGLQMLQIREKQLDEKALIHTASLIRDIAKPYGTKVLINQNVSLAQSLGLDGVHLTSAGLMALEEKPKDLIVAASCHDAMELEKAESLALDFVTVSPVNATASHPDASTLGWQDFTQLIGNMSIPIYALGGMQMRDINMAQQCGARGVAMQRAIWTASET